MSTVICLCGSIKLELAEPLPCPTDLCHCNPCRHTTGAFFAGFVDLTTAPNKETLSKCTAYHSSDSHTRYFCSTCGTKVFIYKHRESDGSPVDEWYALSGAIDPADEVKDGVVDVTSHNWIADTGDGGMAAFMHQLGGREVPCYETSTESKLISPSEVEAMTKTSLPHPAPDNLLRAECHCRGVSLLIKRADHTDGNTLDRFTPKDRNGNPINDKYMAFVCVCRSCRLHTGVSITPWLYLPPAQVLNAHTNEPVVQHREVTEGSNKGLTLTHYWSSPDGCRCFCSTCGAAVFYSYEKRLEILNVAPGLLRAEEGVMARRWLEWQWCRTAWWKEGSTARDLMEAWQATAGS